MRDVFPKFIVEGNNLVIGKCTYHKQLATDIAKVKGGGWWQWRQGEKEFILHGTSDDFGTATADDIIACIQAGNVFLSYMGGRLVEDHTFYLKTDCETIKLNNP